MPLAAGATDCQVKNLKRTVSTSEGMTKEFRWCFSRLLPSSVLMQFEASSLGSAFRLSIVPSQNHKLKA
jgi:hypothetical protein